jgi:serine/threonine-protein kinase
MVEALEAICEAHAAGIVHRDLKPSNLFLADKADGSRRVKVLDFGISKFARTAAPDVALTSTASMLGSPGYMSPEQVRSTKSVDVRTDIWSLGVILYELLTGVPAFTGETLGDVFAKIREEDLPPIRTRRPQVPRALAAVLGECLQRDRDKRIADAATLRRRLLPFAGAGDGRVRVSSPAEHRADISSAETIAAPGLSHPSPEPARLGGETLATWAGDRSIRRRGRLVVGGALALVASGGAIWLLVARGRGDQGQMPHVATSETAVVAQGASTMGEAPKPPMVTPLAPASATATPTGTAVATATGSAAAGHASGEAHRLPHAASAKLPTRVAPGPTSPPSSSPSAAPSTTRRKEDLGI